MNITIRVGDSLLQAVPAIHNKAVFARQVKNLCRSKLSRPAAIAVEMEPEILGVLISFMKELGISPARKTSMPCMLGLVAQEIRWPNLQSLLCLSSTDSIIEAVRSSIELDIPVYGIDTHEFPSKTPMEVIQDPLDAQNNFSGYIERNEGTAGRMRDPEVDSRRESAMGKILKRILLQYDNVLYTGGLAHWKELKRLLADPDLAPDETVVSINRYLIKPVIVHPQVALAYMDILPIITTRYEKERESSASASLNSAYSSAGRYVLDHSYHNFSISEKNTAKSEIENRFPDFERILLNKSLLSQHKVPTMGDFLDSGQAMMPRKFNRVLANTLMDIEREWASQTQFPELPVLFPDNSDSRTQSNRSGMYASCREGKTGQRIPGFSPPSQLFLEMSYEDLRKIRMIQSLWSWPDEPREKKQGASWYSWIWPPCEALLYGTAYQAMRIACDQAARNESTVFEGSLHSGLDIKATTRSMIQGRRSVYVKNQKTIREKHSPDNKHPEPAVFIFPRSEDEKGDQWSLLIGGSSIGDHVVDKDKFREIVDEKGDQFIATISYEHSYKMPESQGKILDSATQLSGVTVFGNPCINSIQAAAWVESADYRCCPIVQYSSISNLVREYAKSHNMEIDLDDWQSALIRFAIPFVKERLVIIAPDHFILPPLIRQQANARNITVSVLPLSYFPKEKINEIRQRISVRSLDRDGCHFAAEVEFELGQAPDTYFDLLPAYMQQQLAKSKTQ